MRGRRGLKLIVEMVVFGILILLALLFLGVRSSGEAVDPELLATMFLLLVPVGISTTFFLGRYIEKRGYRKGDVKRLHVILDENWDDGDFVRDVQRIIMDHLILWWLLDMALVLTGNVVEAAISVMAIFLEFFAFVPVFLLMVQWILEIPFDLYALASGKEWTVTATRNTGLWIIRASLFGAGFVAVPYILAHTIGGSSLEMVERLLRLGRNDDLIKSLLLLSAQSAAFGAVEAYLFPKRGKLGFFLLLVVAVMGAAVMWKTL